jgi:hypothetical protein
MLMNVGRPGRYHRCVIVRAALLLCLALAGCAGSPPNAKSSYQDPATCIGGLCVKPDHAVARKVRTEKGSKCMIVAWDGDSALPPTARMGVTDDTPARPGVFLAVEVPGMLAGVPYKLGESSPATAMGVRVDPAVHFADQRLADQGDIILTKSGDEMHVRVRTVWGTHEEVAIIIVARPKNTCGLPVEVN